MPTANLETFAELVKLTGSYLGKLTHTLRENAHGFLTTFWELT